MDGRELEVMAAVVVLPLFAFGLGYVVGVVDGWTGRWGFVLVKRFVRWLRS